MNTTELKAFAEKAAGWKLDATMQTDDDRDEGIAFVGSINDEGIFSDVARIDTGLYYQPDKAIEVAKFIAAANPAAILELISAHEDAQEEIRELRDRLVKVEAEHKALKKAISDTEPVAWCDPTNSDPGQAVTFSNSKAAKWPHIYSQPLYTLEGIRTKP